MLIPPLHALQMRPDCILLAYALLGSQHGDVVVTGVAFHPSPVLRGALRQDLRGDGILAVHVAEEMNDVLRPGQQRQVSLDDDAVETVIYKNQEAFEKLREGFHRSPPQWFGWIPKSSVQAAGGINCALAQMLNSLSLGFQGRSPWLSLDTTPRWFPRWASRNRCGGSGPGPRSRLSGYSKTIRATSSSPDRRARP